ncbi:MAG: glutathione S-transferase N-terminal domain-containing protein [Proteobacteria bacterium]|nr:glutathione S-transferase N-terminal domain-containing protein [Pseudomonadota bacterium]
MYTLYYLPGSCSLAVHVALNEVGADFKLENVAVPNGQPRSPEFLKINPRGGVPVLKIDDFILREGAAILTYLLDTHKSALLPQSGLERASALEWLCFANSTLHPAYGRCFFQHGVLGDLAKENPLYKPSIEKIQKSWNEIEEHLQTRDYLCGNNCTIADILVTVIANWSPMMKEPINFGPKTKAFFTRVISRPSYQKAMATEQVTYKVNV